MRIHLIAIGGSAMHNLAMALADLGHTITGSDDEIFEPSRSRLKAKGLLPKTMGWQTQNITENLDFVILGMHARPDNPELAKALELGLAVRSYPEFIYEQSKDKTRIVIAGSHGKTSITAMILHALHYHNREVDFMVGAQLAGFDNMVKFTKHNEFMLLEGDEYLSSPIDRQPKFIHYKPNIALLSGIAWDHVNVFPKYEDYLQQFDKLIEVMVPGGALVYNQTDPEVVKVVERSTNEIKHFGYGIPEYKVVNNQVVLNTPEGDVPLQIFGEHNMNNLEGARWICNQMGLSDEEFYEAIPSFTGASSRLEKLSKTGNLIAYRDFAHAPSKVAATTKAVKETYPNKKVIACFELHTFSSLSKAFLSQYQGALAAADVALVYFNPQVLEHKKLPPLSVNFVQEAFADANLQVANSRQALLDFSQKHSQAGNVFLLMSSGNFDGINWREELSKLAAH
jgi:UDP-N-acetylmuramate: L-alanyl-gamma-D-glutamyl-meso-diaminopimelate ligase